mmetsp:Transcript_30658/g.49176  ORF Transcript_30658/g.49176 Transcript_30658/m.49176 type:complete len:653 (-) Transcript_30658:1332-3290(-)
MEALFIFNRRLGSNDETATVSELTEKLLFYTSSCGDDLEEQLERLSLCETFIDVCRGFMSGHPCESVYLDDHQYSLYECEPDTWVVVCCKSRLAETQVDGVEGPAVTSSSYSAYSYSSPVPSKRSPIQRISGSFQRGKPANLDQSTERKLYKKGRKQGTGTENIRLFEASDPNPKVLRSLLLSLYEIFTLLNGRIRDLLWPKEGEDIPGKIKELRKTLRKSRQIQELVDEGDLVPDPHQQELLDNRAKNEDTLANLLSMSTADIVRVGLCGFIPNFLKQVDFLKLHLLYDVSGLPFLSADKSTFLSTQHFMNLFLTKFPEVVGCALFCNSHILWNSLPLELLKRIYKYLEMWTGENNKSGPSGLAARRPGFVEIGHVSAKQHPDRSEQPFAKPVESVDSFFPLVYHVEKNKHYRMFVYMIETTFLVVLVDNIRPNNLKWDTTQLLQFSVTFEECLGNDIVRLVETIANTHVTAKEVASNSMFLSYTGSIDSISSSITHSEQHSRATRTIVSSTHGNNDSTERYLYINGAGSVVKISEGWLESLYPKSPLGANHQLSRKHPSLKQMGGLFTPDLIMVLCDIRKQFLDSSADMMEIFQLVQPKPKLHHHPGCWVAALKSNDRQVFIVVDRKNSFDFVTQRLRSLRETSLRSILL